MRDIFSYHIKLQNKNFTRTESFECAKKRSEYGMREMDIERRRQRLKACAIQPLQKKYFSYLSIKEREIERTVCGRANAEYWLCKKKAKSRKVICSILFSLLLFLKIFIRKQESAALRKFKNIFHLQKKISVELEMKNLWRFFSLSCGGNL